MKQHRTESVGLTAMVLAITLELFPVVARAATETIFGYAPTTISVLGHPAVHTQHVVAKDPWSGVETTWIPVTFVQEALKQVGFKTTWNGTAFSLIKYPPGHTLAALGNPEAHPAARNQIQIYLVAGAPPSAVIPKLVAKNPASGIRTVYMPIFYLDNIVLNHYWRMNATWSGVNDTWSLRFQPTW